MLTRSVRTIAERWRRAVRIQCCPKTIIKANINIAIYDERFSRTEKPPFNSGASIDAVRGMPRFPIHSRFHKFCFWISVTFTARRDPRVQEHAVLQRLKRIGLCHTQWIFKRLRSRDFIYEPQHATGKCTNAPVMSNAMTRRTRVARAQTQSGWQSWEARKTTKICPTFLSSWTRRKASH